VLWRWNVIRGGVLLGVVVVAEEEEGLLVVVVGIGVVVLSFLGSIEDNGVIVKLLLLLVSAATTAVDEEVMFDVNDLFLLNVVELFLTILLLDNYVIMDVHTSLLLLHIMYAPNVDEYKQ
jgi:hypothetical protein